MLTTDWQSPTSGVLARLNDARARQYWDPHHLVAQRLAADARDPQPRQACCLRDNFLWDLAALYPPGVEWKDAMPPRCSSTAPWSNGRRSWRRLSIFSACMKGTPPPRHSTLRDRTSR